MDLRELLDVPEEDLRAVFRGFLANLHTALPAHVVEDTADGHVATVQPTIKRAQADPKTVVVTYAEHPVHPDVPIHHMGGGGVSKTFPNKRGDTGALIYMARAMDAWFQSDGVQQPMEDRMHSLADGVFLSGIRSVPRKLQQVSADAAQDRSDDKHHVSELHPQNGHRKRSVDPSTPKASQDYDPDRQATRFYEARVHPSDGHASEAVADGTTHAVTVTHDAGPKMSAKNGEHTVHADPGQGVSIASTIAHLIQAPNASLDKGGNLSVSGSHSAAGSISAGGAVSGASGSFANGISFGEGGSGGSMTGTGLGRDLAGTFDQAKVAGASSLPRFPTAAAALAALGPDRLYVNTTLGAQAGSTSTSGSGPTAVTATTPPVPSFFDQGVLVVCVTGTV